MLIKKANKNQNLYEEGVNKTYSNNGELFTGLDEVVVKGNKNYALANQYNSRDQSSSERPTQAFVDEAGKLAFRQTNNVSAGAMSGADPLAELYLGNVVGNKLFGTIGAIFRKTPISAKISNGTLNTFKDASYHPELEESAMRLLEDKTQPVVNKFFNVYSDNGVIKPDALKTLQGFIKGNRANQIKNKAWSVASNAEKQIPKVKYLPDTEEGLNYFKRTTGIGKDYFMNLDGYYDASTPGRINVKFLNPFYKNGVQLKPEATSKILDDLTATSMHEANHSLMHQNGLSTLYKDHQFPEGFDHSILDQSTPWLKKPEEWLSDIMSYKARVLGRSGKLTENELEQAITDPNITTHIVKDHPNGSFYVNQELKKLINLSPILATPLLLPKKEKTE